MSGERRTAVVTGANRGIGYEVARALLGRGYHVVVVARDADRARAAASSLRSAQQGASVEPIGGGLDSLESIRTVAASIAAGTRKIDVLVHNAGWWPRERRLTADGFEEAYAVNHLAPFVLNRVLEPTLAASRTRVVQVSAGLYVRGKPDPRRTPRGDDFHPLWTYATTKAANLALVPVFAERWRDAGVTIDAVHPGVIRTGLGDRPGLLGVVLRAVKHLWKTPEAGAAPIVRLATDPRVMTGTGRFFDVDRETKLQAPLDDPALAAQLWVDACDEAGFSRSPRRDDDATAAPHGQAAPEAR